MNNIVDVTVYKFMELNLKKWKNKWCMAESKRMLQVFASAICPRRYWSSS